MKKFTPLFILACIAAVSVYAQDNVGIGTNVPLTKLDIKGALSLREGVALSLSNGGASNGINDNISLPDISGTTDISSFYRITGPTSVFSIYGIAPATGADGQIVTLVNTTGKVMTIINNGSFTTANGIITQTGANLVDNSSSTANSSITLHYNKYVGKWYVTATQNFTTPGSITGVSNTSDTNKISTTVNGVTGATVPIINAHTLTQNGTNQLTSAVNGVSAGPVTLNVTGDVIGNLGADTVAGIEGKAISLSSLATNNMLQYNGSNWVNVAPSASLVSAWGLTGNSSVETNFIGTTNNYSFKIKTNNTERMVIDSLGNVGIGTTAPVTGMEVVDNYANKNVITVENTSNTGYSSVDFWDNTGALQGTFGYANTGVTNTALAGNTYFYSYGNDFSFGNNKSNYNLFIKDSTGNVGIGTSSPNYPLDVAGDINTSTGFTISGGASGGKYLRGNGTNFVASTIQASDVPTLNQSTTGNAATVTTNANLTGPVTSAGNATAITNNAVTLAMQAQLAANSVIGNSNGSAATPTAVPMTSSATASTIAFRDANGNLAANNQISGMVTTATAASTTTLTVGSAYMQRFTGTATQTVVLPSAATLAAGQSYFVTNRSTGVVTVEANGGTVLQAMAAGSQCVFTVISISTAPGTWDVAYSAASAGGTTFASPTAVIGLNTVTGSATTAMRSDAAPALDTSIAPTWSGTHTFSNATYSALFTGGNVGIGTTAPPNTFSVSPQVSYSTGTVKQAGATVTGSGTTFTAAMVGGEIIYSTGATATITTFSNSITLKVTPSQTIPSGTSYTINYNPLAGLQVTSAGNVGVGTTAPSDKLQVNDGNIGIANDDNTAGSLKFYEPSTSGSNYMSFTAAPMTANVAYTLPGADGSGGQVLSTNGSGTLSWATPGTSSIGTSYAVTPANNDPNSSFGGTYAEVAEVAVTVASGDVLITNGFFSAETANTYLAIRVTRSNTSGSGSPGTVVAYSGTNQNGGNKYSSVPIVSHESAVAAGTWYYKLWATGYTSGTQSYEMVTTKAQ